MDENKKQFNPLTGKEFRYITCSLCGFETYDFIPGMDDVNVFFKLDGKRHELGIVCKSCRTSIYTAVYEWIKNKLELVSEIKTSAEACPLCKEIELEETKIKGSGIRACYLETINDGIQSFIGFCSTCENEINRVGLNHAKEIR